MMNNSEEIMTRYLLGELSESEQAALEEKYFTDPQVFDQVVKAENELVDNYVRGRLSPPERERFERYYLAHPDRRARVKFAEALLARLDQIEDVQAAAGPPVAAASWWHRLLQSLRGQRLTLGLSLALASLLIAVGGLRLFVETKRLRQALQETQAARANEEQRARELEQRVANERRRTEELATELERLRTERPRVQPTPAPPARSVPTFVSLLLTMGGPRGTDTGPPATLVIPPGTEQVRLQLNLKDQDYPSYRAVLQAVGGEEVFRRPGLTPKPTPSGARLVLVVPARQFATGDYLLTLKGIRPSGEVDDVSQSLFRVEKK